MDGFMTRRSSEANSVTAQRMAGIHFDQVQLSVIQRRLGGSLKWEKWNKLDFLALSLLSQSEGDTCLGAGGKEGEIGEICTLSGGCDAEVSSLWPPIDGP